MGNSKWFYRDFSCIPKPENDKGVEGEDEGEGDSKTKQEGVEGEQSLRQLELLARLVLKGQCHEMEICFKGFKYFNQYFLCMRWWFLKSFNSFSLPYKIVNFLYA